MTFHAKQHDNSFGSASGRHSSAGYQAGVDAQLMGDQIRAIDAQLRADTHRMNERLRIDKQRIDAHFRAGLQRVQNGIQQMDRDMREIDWHIDDIVSP